MPGELTPRLQASLVRLGSWMPFGHAARELAVGLVRGTPMANMIEQRGGDFERIADAVAAALAEFGGAAPFRSPQRAIVFTARAG